MYKLLTPWRSLGRNLYRYLIFGLLLVLLFTLNFSVRRRPIMCIRPLSPLPNSG